MTVNPVFDALTVNGPLTGQVTTLGTPTARTMAARGADTFNLKDYGAVMDGVTDDTAAFNACMAAMPGSGGEIVIPYAPGGVVLGGITLGKSIRVRGMGGPYGQSTIIASSATTTVFTVTALFCALENLAFNAFGSGKQTAGAYVNVTAGAARFVAWRLTMNEWYQGISVNGASDADISDSRFLLYSTTGGISLAAINVFGNPVACRIRNILTGGPTAPQSTAGIWVQNAGDIYIGDSQIISMGTDLLVTPGTGQSVSSLWASNTFFDTATRGIDLSPTGTGTILRSRFIGCWSSSHTYDGVRIGAGTNGVEFIGHESFLNGGHGMLVSGGSRIQAIGGMFAANAGDGLHVAAGVSYWGAVDVLAGQNSGFAGNSGYGIVVDSGASDYYRITGNTVDGNAGGAISDSGTGVHKAVWQNPGDPNDFVAYRNNATGMLRFSGTQASPYDGYEWYAAGLFIGSLTPSGLITNSIQTAGMVIDASTVTVAPTTGQTVSVPSLCAAYIINPTGTLATLTVTSPNGPTIVGSGIMPLTIIFMQAVTALTWAAGTAAPYGGVAMPSSAAVGTQVVLKWVQSLSRWVHVGNA